MTIKKSIIKLLIIIIMLVICCTIIGCQPTPDEAVVLENNPEEFQEMIMVKNDSTEVYEYPENYYDEFLSKDGKVTILFDAEIVTPSVNKLPVIKINPSPISDEMVNWAVDEFIESKDGFYPTIYMNREEAEALRISLEGKLKDEEKLYEEYGSEIKVTRVKENLTKTIEYLDEYYNDEDSKQPKILTKFVLRPYEFYLSSDMNLKEKELSMTKEQLEERSKSGTNLYLSTDVMLSDGKYVRLGIYNVYPYDLTSDNDESMFYIGKYQIHVVYSYIPLNIHPTFILQSNPYNMYLAFGSLDMYYPELSRTLEDSTNIALEELSDLGINNFYVESIKEDMGTDIKERHYQTMASSGLNSLDFDKYCKSIDTNYKFHKITFKPYYYGVPLIEANQVFYDEDIYYSPIEYEVISVRMSEDGIAEFKWTNPTDISNVLNDNVKIISLETAIENAKQFMTLKYNLPTLLSLNTDNPDYDKIIDLCNKANINIDTIKLGLAGIPAYNSTNEYLLIPVWNFYGSYSVESDIERYAREGSDKRVPFLSVNAIDGSIIMQEATITY